MALLTSKPRAQSPESGARSLKPELLLFDLGGVLVDFSGARDLPRLMRTPAAPADILTRWIACPHTTAYEAGRLPAAEWAARFVREWDLTVTPEEFIDIFTGWSRGLVDGAAPLLADLRHHYRLAALSNSNELHWKRNMEIGVLREFELALASYELGCCKPDPEIFRIAIRRAQVSSPAAIMFFDDFAPNVDAARAAGLRAHQVQGLDGLRERIYAEGLL